MMQTRNSVFGALSYFKLFHRKSRKCVIISNISEVDKRKRPYETNAVVILEVQIRFVVSLLFPEQQFDAHGALYQAY